VSQNEIAFAVVVEVKSTPSLEVWVSLGASTSGSSNAIDHDLIIIIVISWTLAT
jgi:hypothetical protein